MPITRSYLADHAIALRDKPAVVDDRPGAPVTVWSFAELNRQAMAQGVTLVELRPEQPSLEETFLSMTTKEAQS